MLKILLIVGFVIWVSTTIGIIIKDRFNLKEMRFTAPIGFAVLLSILQLFYYPIQLFNLNSFYVHFISFSVFAIVSIISFFYFERVIKQYLNWGFIWVLLSLG